MIRSTWSFFRNLFRQARQRSLSRRINHLKPGGHVVLNDPFLKVTIDVRKGAKFVLRGKLSFNPYLGSHEPITIILEENSTLEIDGDFDIGNGVRIYISSGGCLYFGGKRLESASGITEKTLIMVHKNVRIGTDFICAWGCYITDCDWHNNVGKAFQENTIIGDHVWVAANCSILKGSHIGNGCVIATGSIVHRMQLPDRALGGGAPFRALSSNREWHRDMPAEL